jgi:acyl dehydratase
MTAVVLSTDRLGIVADEYRVTVDPAEVARYAASIGQPQDGVLEGSFAPPLFGVVPARRAVLAALRAVVPEEVGRQVPVLHGEQDVQLARPLRCGDVVQVRSRPLGVRQKTTGCVILLEVELSVGDEVTEQQRMVVYLPGATGAPDAGQAPTPLAPVSLGEDRRMTPTYPRQSRDYAAVSQDDTSFHVDDEAARAYGFPGVIMHGLCTLATVVGDLLPALGHDAARVQRVAARFTSPAYPGGDLVVRYGEQVGGIAFSATDPTGRSLLERGWVALR